MTFKWQKRPKVNIGKKFRRGYKRLSYKNVLSYSFRHKYSFRIGPSIAWLGWESQNLLKEIEFWKKYKKTSLVQEIEHGTFWLDVRSSCLITTDTQCLRTDLNKRSLPIPKTTTAWKLTQQELKSSTVDSTTWIFQKLIFTNLKTALL